MAKSKKSKPDKGIVIKPYVFKVWNEVSFVALAFAIGAGTEFMAQKDLTDPLVLGRILLVAGARAGVGAFLAKVTTNKFVT